MLDADDEYSSPSPCYPYTLNFVFDTTKGVNHRLVSLGIHRQTRTDQLCRRPNRVCYSLRLHFTRHAHRRKARCVLSVLNLELLYFKVLFHYE